MLGFTVYIMKKTNIIRILVAITLLSIVVMTICLAMLREGPQQHLTDFGPMPEFTLLDQDGQSWASSSFEGSTILISFLYTKCLDSCPILAHRLSYIHKELSQSDLFTENLLFVSIVLDDGPLDAAELQTYRETANLPDKNWVLLTGTRKQVTDLMTEGFKLALNIEPSIHVHADGSLHRHAEGSIAISHSNRLILVDQSRSIRRYYDGLSIEPTNLIADLSKFQ